LERGRTRTLGYTNASRNDAGNMAGEGFHQALRMGYWERRTDDSVRDIPDRDSHDPNTYRHSQGLERVLSD
jgi:hypothetical protein